MPNWERIEKLASVIAKTKPSQVHMGTLLRINRDGETIKEALAPSCGTVGCMAGWSALLFSENKKQQLKMVGGYGCNVGPSIDIWKTAVTALDLTPEEADHAFYAKWDSEHSYDDDITWKPLVLRYLCKAIKARDMMVTL